MGWLSQTMSDDTRGPTNDPEWRKRHPESTKPLRKPGTKVCVCSYECSRGFGQGPSGAMAWDVHPKLYTFFKQKQADA